MMTTSANMWYQSPWLENRELRSELHDPRKKRMIKMNNEQGNGGEINNDPDYISPRLRAIAILKQEIAIMELQYEIALLEYESERHEDNGDGGEVITRKEEDDPERDEMACEDVLDKKNKENYDHEEEESEGYNRNRSPEMVTEIVDRNHDILFFKNDMRRQKYMIKNESSDVKMKKKGRRNGENKKERLDFQF
ncbi:hypothetical protein Hanom_Chr02g00177541 [Helianthus anomalus]